MKNYFQKILSLFARHNYSEQTNQMFYRWLVDNEYEKEKDEALQELYLEARKKGKVFDLEKSLERWKLDNNLTHVQPQQKSDKKLFMRLWQSVAVILLIVSISLGYLLCKAEKDDSGITQQCISGTQMKTFFLPDGSRVSMNSRSMLLYPEQFTGKYRSVFLIGEANFKVKANKNKPFIVKTNDFQITALGTEFNVNAYPENNELIATLLEGSVKVEFNNLISNVILKPNEQITYNKQTRKRSLQSPRIEDVTAWQRGELVFSDMHLDEIFTSLERKFPYTFVYSLHSLNNKSYSFRFQQQATLEEVMKIITQVAGDVKYIIKGNKCYITDKI